MKKFDWFLSTVSNEIDYEYDNMFYSGKDCSRMKLEEVLSDFVCDTSDIVVFCYFGHGGRSTDDTSLFPQMCLHEKYQKDFVPLEKAKNILAKQGARLTWVIGDCCNSYSEYIQPKDVSAAPSETRLPGASISLIAQLFRNTTGIVTMCASKPGTYGWSNNAYGMYFNNALIKAINSASINSIIPNQPWQSVMSIVQKDLYAQTFYDREDLTHTPHKMVPQYRIEPRMVKKGSGVKPPKMLPQTMQRDLSAIANRNAHPIERTRLISGFIQNHLSGEGVVRTISEDGVPYGSIYTFRNYLGRIARAENIVNVIIRNVKMDEAGKVTYMEVHEIFTELK